jgi:hypothetical protein
MKFNARHNEFWQSTMEFHLESLLNKAYELPKKKQLIQKWLAGAKAKNIMVNQTDFPSDPLLLEFGEQGWTYRVLEDEQPCEAQVVLNSTHIGLIAYTDKLRTFIRGYLTGVFCLPKLFKNPCDHYFVMRIFLMGW